MIITLTTDWGENEIYTAALKGNLLTHLQINLSIIDISHSIEQGNIGQAAFMVKTLYSLYPVNTIHFILVNDFDTSNCYWITKHEQHFFVAKNFTTLSYIFAESTKDVDILQLPNTISYHNIVKQLTDSPKLLEFDKTFFTEQNKLTFPIPKITSTESQTKIIGRILYYNATGSAITNITESILKNTNKTLQYILVNTIENKIYSITPNEQEIQPGKIYAKFNIFGNLEIVMKFASLRQYLSLDFESSIIVILK